MTHPTHTKLATLVLSLLIAVVPTAAPAGIAYPEPAGGWTYVFDGDSAQPDLDGTWNHNNTSDQWDNSAIGAGKPGGVSALNEAVSFIRIQDAFPRDPGAEPSNRKIYFTHDLAAQGAPSDLLDTGVTISFRIRLATTPPLDPLDGSSPWPDGGDGYNVHDGGKGNIGIRAANGKLLSFCLILASDNGALAGRQGLTMNSLSGTSPSKGVDTGEGTLNLLEIADLTAWHEFFVNIQGDTSEGGTHLVTIWMDGSSEPSQFHVTAGTGSDAAGSYLAMGCGSTGQSGAFDVDFFAYKAGLHQPTGGIVNQAPDVEAGDDQTKWLRSSSVTFELDGQVSDDGVGEPNGYLAVQWRRIGGSGEGPILFIPDGTVPNPSVRLYDFGTYVLELEATDGQKTAVDTVTLTVNEGLKGDLHLDNRVNWLDLEVFCAMWLDGPDTIADLVGSDGVNAYDYAVLMNNWWSQTNPAEAMVQISEFMADNRDTLFTIYEPGGEQHSPDWIEIHNLDVNSVDLTGWYLTDGEPNSWRFPDGFTIPAGGYRLVFASGLAGADEQFRDPYGYYHTNFQLDKNGEYLALVAPDKTTIVHQFAAYEYQPGKFGFPPQQEDYSYGVLDSAERYFSSPTPGAENSGEFEGFVADTTFSKDRGFYYTDFYVEISSATPGATIRYTTDGSAPSSTHGQVYDPARPIHITTTTTLRAIAYKRGWMPTNVDTHTYIFPEHVLHQATDPHTGAQVTPPGYPASWGSIAGDYQVDPEIVNHPDPCDRLHASDMLDVPTFSLVMDREDLFGSNQIYLSGDSRERLCSIEMIYGDGTTAFQENGIVQIQGGSSTGRWKSKKLSLRYKFKEKMKDGTPTGGPRKLSYRLYPNGPVERFDNIIFDAVLNNSWSHGRSSSQRKNCMFIQDQYVSDLHNAMGGNSPQGLFAHVYLNGLYWGMYYVHDRPDHAWAQEMFGGDKEEYHALKHNKVTINNGNGASAVGSYNAMLSAAEAAGNNPTSLAYWDALTRRLDVDNLITYLLAHWFPGTDDWAGSSGKNAYYTCREAPDGRWRHHTWDAEHTMKFGDVGFGNSPHYIHDRLKDNVEYKLRFGDIAHRVFLNDGPLSGLKPREMYLARMAEIDRAIVGESARWGDAWDSSPHTRSEWLNVQAGKLSKLVGRGEYMLNKLKSAGLYPALEAPVFNPHGGWSADEFDLVITGPAQIWYTLDGTDPRLPGGAVNSAHALPYSGPISLTESAAVKARCRSGGTWSALNEAVFAVGPVAENLRITEIMYHPRPTGDPLDPNKEFIELKNIGPVELNLHLVSFTEGIRFTFGPGTTLAPGQNIVLVRDRPAFEAEYPGLSAVIAGIYLGSLDNAGERVRLEDALGRTIHDFKYKDSWQSVTDGAGFSLTIKDATADPADWGLERSWGASTYQGGSPGTDDTGPKVGDVLINEVLVHSDTEPYDWVELYNPTEKAIDIGGWWLSDDGAEPNLTKYRIPVGTTIGSGQYLLFTEAQFGDANDPDCFVPFALSENGETVYLSSGIPGEFTLTGFREARRFRASDPDVAFGLYTKSAAASAAGDPTDFVAMSRNSPGMPNTYPPAVGPVVIAEIMYNPPDPAGSELEYIRLVNISDSTVTLQRYYPVEGITLQWKFTDGISYTFPPDTTIAAGDHIYLVNDPAAFSAAYPGVAQARIFGPFGDDPAGHKTSLSNSGEDLELAKPGDKDYRTGERFYILVDRVNYSDGSHPKEGFIDPWPADADGNGKALVRKVLAEFGNDPDNWTAGTPSP